MLVVSNILLGKLDLHILSRDRCLLVFVFISKILTLLAKKAHIANGTVVIPFNCIHGHLNPFFL